jgi:hypothetical protein
MSFPHYGPSIVAFMDVPLIPGDDELPWSPRVAVYHDPMPTAVGFARLEDEQYLPFDAINVPATMGHLVDELPPGQPWIVDHRVKFCVKLYGTRSLLSINRDQFLRGGNLICVEGQRGWELLQFMSAELVGDHTYELSALLRGQFGTEHRMGAPKGARFVLWDQAYCQPLALPQDTARLTVDLRYGPANHNPTDWTWTDKRCTFTSQGIMPYAPVQLRARRRGAAHELSWVRRTRIGGDAWEQIDVPLGEERELYDAEVVVSDGLDDEVVASIEDTPMTIWSIPKLTRPATLRVWQKSAVLGRGTEASLRIE